MHQSCILYLCHKTLNQEICNKRKTMNDHVWCVIGTKTTKECMDDIYYYHKIQKLTFFYQK